MFCLFGAYLCTQSTGGGGISSYLFVQNGVGSISLDNISIGEKTLIFPASVMRI